MQSNVEQQRLAEAGRALGPTTFDDDLANFSANVRSKPVQGPPQARTIFDIDTTFDPADTDESFMGGDVPLSVAPLTSGKSAFDADAIMEEEEKFGTLPTKTLVDIERLSNVPIGQRRTGEGDDTPFFQGLGLPSFFDGIERFSRDRMASRLARGDVPEKNIIRNDSGLVIGIKDNFGNLMEGIDPNAPIGQDDGNDQTPIIRPIVAPKEEEKKDDDRPPNVIGGGVPRPAPEPVQQLLQVLLHQFHRL